MRTKVLGPNQRIQIGTGFPSDVGGDMPLIARILRTVGLTLEVESSSGDSRKMYLYAARRPVTNDVVSAASLGAGAKKRAGSSTASLPAPAPLAISHPVSDPEHSRE